MRRRTLLFRNPRRIFGILVLILLMLVLSFVVFHIQQQTIGSVQIPGTTSSQSPIEESVPVPGATSSATPARSATPASSATPPRAPYPANIDNEGLSRYGTYHPSALANPNVAGSDINLKRIDGQPQQAMFNGP